MVGPSRRPRAPWVIVAIVEPTRRRSQRDGEETRSSSSAQRYGSSWMPRAYGWARLSTVIQSSASRAARRRSCQVRSGSSARARSRRLNANQRGSRRSSRSSWSASNSHGPAGSRRVAVRKPRSTAAMSGQRTPYTGPSPGATWCCPASYSGSARRWRPSRSSAANASGSCVSSASAAPSRSASSRRAATNATARSVVALRVAVAVVIADPTPTATGNRSAPVARPAVARRRPGRCRWRWRGPSRRVGR